MATSVLNKENPAKDVVAIGADLHKAAPSFESALRQARPQVSKLPMIGSIAKGTSLWRICCRSSPMRWS